MKELVNERMIEGQDVETILTFTHSKLNHSITYLVTHSKFNPSIIRKKHARN